MKRKIVWGSIGQLFSGNKGKQAGHDYHVRKPHYADLDLGYGKRLTTKRVEELRNLALSHGTPETRLADGFHEDVFVATISDESKDRYGDRILVNGWMLEEYRKNPVLLFGHDYGGIAVGHALDIYQDAVGASGETRTRLRGVFLWSRANPEAAILKGVYEDGDMRAFSVGFIPEEFLAPEDEDERKELDLGPWGVLHQKQTLLENSAVPVPANPNAITEESVKAFRGAVPQEELPGLRKLAQRLHDVNLEISKGLLEFFPNSKAQTDAVAPPTALDKGVVPADVSTTKADQDEAWSAPNLSDFTEKAWEELTSAEMQKIAGHFAWADASPASAYGQLSLPHHRSKDGAIVFKGVSAAAGRLDQTEMPGADKAGVKRHLRAHYAAFEMEPPDSIKSTAEELAAVLAWVKETHSELTYTLAVEAAEMKDNPTEAVDSIFKLIMPVEPQQFRASLSPEGELEDVKPEGETHDPNPSKTTADPEPSRAIPVDVSTEMAPKEEEWEELVADDFPDFVGLDEEGRGVVAGFFAWSAQLPPTEFDQLSYGHHRADDGHVNLAGVQQAMDDLLGGTEGTPEGERRAVYDHLANHYEGFEETPPEFKMVEPDNGQPAKLDAGQAGGDIDPIIGSNAKLKAEILAALRVELATDPEGEHKWRVVRAHKPEKAPEDTTMKRADWEKAVGDNIELRRQTSLIYDANDTKNPKGYLMPHHLAEEGTPVVFDATRRAMRTLLSKSIDGTIPESVRRRAYFHLRTHYEQFDKEAPAFRSIEQLATLARFLEDSAGGLVNGTTGAELMLDLVYMGYQSASEAAYEIQALKFEANHWEKSDAEAFARQHGFDASKFSEEAGIFTFEQRAADDFVALRSKRLNEEPDTNGVEAVGGRLKTQAGILSERLTKVENAVTDGIAKVLAFKSEFIGLLTEGSKKGSNGDLIRKLAESRNSDNFGAILEQTTKALEIADRKLRGHND